MQTGNKIAFNTTYISNTGEYKRMLHVIDAKYIGDYKISVKFNDGCCFVTDFESVIKSDHLPIVQQLADINTFKDFTLQAHTITWSNGVDFAPEFIKSLQ